MVFMRISKLSISGIILLVVIFVIAGFSYTESTFLKGALHGVGGSGCKLQNTLGKSCVVVSLASSPVSDTVVKGQDRVSALGLQFKAGTASDITVTALTLTAYFDEDLDGIYAAGVDNGVNLNSVVGDVSLQDNTGSTVSSARSLSTDGTVTFSGLSLNISAGTSEILYTVVSIGSNSDAYRFAFDVATLSSEVVAEDVTGNSASIKGSNNPNGGTSPTVILSVEEQGEIQVTVSDDSVLDGTASAGNGEILVARFSASADLEDFVIERMTFHNDTAAGADDGAIQTVILAYPTDFSDPTTLDGREVGYLVGSIVRFDGLDLAVPDGMAVDFEVFVTTYDIGAGANVGDIIEMDFVGSNFKAIGQTSGSVVTLASDVDVNQITLE